MATDNEILASIEETLLAILASQLSAYSILAGGDVEQEVTNTTPYERAANTNAKKVIVVNTGETDSAYIYEAGNLLKILAPGESWVCPTNGVGAFQVFANPNGTTATTIHFTTAS